MASQAAPEQPPKGSRLPYSVLQRGHPYYPIHEFSTSLNSYLIQIDNPFVSRGDVLTVRGTNLTPLLHYQARLDRAGDIRDFDRLPSVGYNSADSTKTSGFDLEFNHKHRFDWFDFKSDLPWKYMKRYSIEIHGVTYQLAGTHDPSGTSGDTGNARDHLQWSNAGTIGNFRWPKR